MLFACKPIDEELRENGYTLIAGVDEAGRGPLAGPVFAAAVILPPDPPLPAVMDSKKLNAPRREELYLEIQATSLCWHIARVDHDVIDATNILKATMRAMVEAVRNLADTPEMILVDGIHTPFVEPYSRTLKKGDGVSRSIGAASVLAKVARDRHMVKLHEQYPQYGFHRHKGYGTREHREAIARHGPCPVHRKTFAGVREFCEQTGKGEEEPGT